MKIDRMELFAVSPRWLFLKITASDGTFGWGEPIVEGKAATVAACVEEMSDFLIGKDPRHIEDIFQVLYRGGFYRGGPVLSSAISGIEQALWDIKGKALGVPVYDLLGGPVRDKMKVYAWIGGDDPADVAAQAKKRVTEEGYLALKMNATGPLEWIDSPEQVQLAAQRLAAAREAVGPSIGIGIDFHGRVHKGMAKLIAKALEPYSPMFYEEPVLSENNEFLPELAKITSVPIATGERMYTRWDFKKLLQTGGVDIIQPDLSHAGGIWETRKIAAMAEAYRCRGRAALSARPDCAGGVPAAGFLYAERLYSGAEPRHPLQSGQRFVRLPDRPRRFPLQGRLRRPPDRPRSWYRDQRGKSARNG